MKKNFNKNKEIYISNRYNAEGLLIRKECFHLMSAYKLHNPNNEPAYELYYDFDTHTSPQIFKYCINGLLHRENGPALIEWDKQGNVIKEEYYLNGSKVDELVILIKSSQDNNL